MRPRHLTLFALLITTSILPAKAQDRPDEGPIVVTGTRLVDSEQWLEACLARGCSPDEDVRATLAHAENQFVAGDYEAGKQTLRASFRRNRKHAEAHPQLVSELSRANAFVSAHLGDHEDYRRYSWEVLRSLKAGLPEADLRHLVARVEIAEMEHRVRGAEVAVISFRRLAKDAERLGYADVADIACLRAEWISYKNRLSSGDRKALEAIAARHEKGGAHVVAGANILLSNMARNAGDAALADRYMARVTALNLPRPTLVDAPDWQPVEEVAQADPYRWIDVAFYVEPDGRVSDVELLRENGDPTWAKELLSSIEKRRYTPSDPATGGSYRVERYTYTKAIASTTRSRIKERGGASFVEFLDLTLPSPAGENQSNRAAAGA